MRLKNIECQLAQGQIGRYLAGTDMSPEAVTQLELHIAECEDCTTFVEQKRKSLKEMAKQTRAVAYIEDPEPEVESPEPAKAPQPAAQALLQAIKDKAAAKDQAVVLDTQREPAPAKPIQWKVFAYSGALGLVLLLMSQLTANPTALFGERAAQPTESTAAPETSANSSVERDPFVQSAPAPNPPVASTTIQPETKSEATPKTASDSEDRAATPASDTRVEEPKPASATSATETISSSSTPARPKIRVTSRPVVRRPIRRSRQPIRAKAPSPSRSSIRVYDENGRVISGA